MPDSLPSIAEAFTCVDDCPRCEGDGIVCENHPDRPWRERGGCMCGAGMPCRPENRTAPPPLNALLGVMRSADA